MSKDSNNSNSLVTFILQMNVKGDLDESWINRSVDYTYNLNEPKTLRFEWFLSEDKTKATLVEVFGDKGKHARSAVGMSGLPFDIPVEIEAIVQISD